MNETLPVPPPWPVAKVAKHFKVDPATIHRWIDAGKIKTTPWPGRRVYIPVSEVLRLSSVSA